MSLEGNYQNRIIKRIIILVLIVSGIIFMTLSNPKQYVYGLVFGASINILNFRLMSLTLEKSVKMSPQKVMPYVAGNYMIRYIIYGIVLGISAIADYISLYTVILGFFMVKIVIISDTLYDMVKNKSKRKTDS
ncbi:ATP synthase subunit I [Brassicibacter mesophilus]|uniref:ATP synthase subunit I n=1 Tax=Brassicibacter mesophilus TaxID=745119 RepID=UPI003D212463